MKMLICCFTFLTISSIASAQVVTTRPPCIGIDADADRDGLSDACELTLAARFAPILVVRSGGCDWDSSSNRIGGGYFFAVQPTDSSVRIAYLPAYFQDCGWRGVKCRLPGVDCKPHAGDSEFIVVELKKNGGANGDVSGVFLSAHCFGRWGKACRWYRGAELRNFAWQATSPVIWVSEGRHANYASSRACDQGLHSIDTCDHHDTRYRFPISALRNIGSRRVPVGSAGCFSGSNVESSLVDSAVSECFWRPDARFRGWQQNASGITGYFRYLVEVAGF